MSWCETECKKKCAIGETECNETWSLYLRKTKNWSEEKEGMGEREKREDRDREKRDKGKNFKRNIDTCLCLLFSFLKALSSRLDSAVKLQLWTLKY